MMIKKIIMLVSLLWISLGAAATNCSALDGTWYGTYTDAYKLFGRGGPWAVIVKFHVNDKEHRFAGQLISGEFTPLRIAYIWGECHDSKLSQVYVLPSVNSCGASSSSVAMDDHNLKLNINWQNPAGMGSTVFNVTLEKGSAKYNDALPDFLSHYLQGSVLPSIKSCL